MSAALQNPDIFLLLEILKSTDDLNNKFVNYDAHCTAVVLTMPNLCVLVF